MSRQTRWKRWSTAKRAACCSHFMAQFPEICVKKFLWQSFFRVVASRHMSESLLSFVIWNSRWLILTTLCGLVFSLGGSITNFTYFSYNFFIFFLVITLSFCKQFWCILRNQLIKLIKNLAPSNISPKTSLKISNFSLSKVKAKRVNCLHRF